MILNVQVKDKMHDPNTPTTLQIDPKHNLESSILRSS